MPCVTRGLLTQYDRDVSEARPLGRAWWHRNNVRILLVEDEPRMANVIAKGLREQAYAVDIAADGNAAIYQTAINDYDLILLDVLLPHRDGFEVCRELRARGNATPILMLTARATIEDRLMGFD